MRWGADAPIETSSPAKFVQTPKGHHTKQVELSSVIAARFSAIRLPGMSALLALLTVAAPASAQTPGEARIAEVITAGDLDGDGRDDIVTLGIFTQEFTEVGPIGISFEPVRTVELTAYRGVDGTRLWRTIVEGHDPTTTMVVAAPVGPEAAPGVLVLSGAFDDDLRNVGFGQTGATYHVDKLDFLPASITALDGAGELAWETRFAEDRVGAFLHVEQILIGGVNGSVKARAGVEHSVIHGTGQYTGSPATDVLVSVSHRAQAGPAAVTVLQAIAVDGASGEAVTLLEHVTPSPAHVRAAGGDLDRDGLDDFLLREPAPTVGLGARSAADGDVIWDAAEPATPDFTYVYSFGDFTGDGVPDPMVAVFPTLWETYPSRLYLLDGATGATHLQLVDRGLAPAGDVDRDGDRDLFLVERDGQDRYRLTVIDAAGTPLRPPVTITEPGSLDFAGDLDGDGLEDLQLTRYFIVGGYLDERPTGRVLGDPLTVTPGGGYALGASLDGLGDDLLSLPVRTGSQLTFEALDGATLEPLWETTVPTPSGTASDMVLRPTPAVDLTGDGTPDVVAFLGNSSARGVVAVDGADGHFLWSSA